MRDKSPAAVVAVIAVPLMVVCCLVLFSPAVIAGVVAWASGWVTGLGAVASTGLAIVAAMLVYGFVRRRRATPPTAQVSAVEPE